MKSGVLLQLSLPATWGAQSYRGCGCGRGLHSGCRGMHRFLLCLSSPYCLGSCISTRLGCQQPSAASENQKHPHVTLFSHTEDNQKNVPEAWEEIPKARLWLCDASGCCSPNKNTGSQQSEQHGRRKHRPQGGLPSPVWTPAAPCRDGWVCRQPPSWNVLRGLAASGQARANLLHISQGHLLW